MNEARAYILNQQQQQHQQKFESNWAGRDKTRNNCFVQGQGFNEQKFFHKQQQQLHIILTKLKCVSNQT